MFICFVSFQPNGDLYESFSVYCPSDKLDDLSLLQYEDRLLEWNKPMYLNFTHKAIVDKIEEFYMQRGGTLEKVYGDVFVMTEPPEEATEEVSIDM